MNWSPATVQQLCSLGEHVIDDRFGVIHSLRQVPVEGGAPPFFVYNARLCNLRACGWQAIPSSVEAAGARRETAALGALVQAIQLYAAGFYSCDELDLFTYQERPENCIDPGEFALFSKDQYQEPGFPYAPFTDTTPVRWISAQAPGSDDFVYVPAVMVRTPYCPKGVREAVIQPETATGLACAPTLDEASTVALCSVVRDDALAVAWHTGAGLPQLRIETLSDTNFALVERFENTVGNVRLFLAPTEFAAMVVIASLFCPASGAPAMTFGAHCAPDPESAVAGALIELALSFRENLKSQARHSSGPRDTDGSVGQSGQPAFWVDDDNAAHADFLQSSTERIDFDTVAGETTPSAHDAQDAILASMATAGYGAYLSDITSTDLAGLGVSVVRAVIPGLQPLFPAESRQALGGHRLKAVQGENVAPHPFNQAGVVAS